MRLRKKITLHLAGFILLTFQLPAQSQVTVFKGATIIPISGKPIQNGVLLVQNGKITDVGENGKISIPANAVVNDASGKVIMPGLVDSHSHLGDVEGGDKSAALHPDVRALDAIDPTSDNFKRALAGGITTINIMPGSGHLMSGQTLFVKMRKGKTLNDLAYCKDLNNDICGGMKMANGTNSMKDPPFPGTRAKSAAMIRELFVKAQDYRKKLELAKTDPSKKPARDLQMEALIEIMDKKRVVHFHTHRHDDVLTVLRLSQEFGFKVVLHHVSEAWMVADEIAKSKAISSIIFIDSPGGKLEAVNLLPKNGAALEKAGADVCFHTDDPITDSRLFIRTAGIAVREGMSKEKALEALTLAGARAMELQGKIGSLEKGKDADFIILSGDPLSVYTHIEQTWVEGTKMFDRSNPEDKAFAVGGYQVYRSELTEHVHD